MKKCPNCGADVPIDNNTCNQCGYSFSGKNGTAFTSVKSSSYGSSGGEFVKTVSNSAIGKFGKIFFTIIFAQIAFVIIIFIAFSVIIFSHSKDVYDDMEYEYYTCDELCDYDDYVEFKGSCICDNDNIYNVTNGEIIYDASLSSGYDNAQLAKCKVFCGEPVSNYNSYSCSCRDGRIYNFDGKEIFEEIKNKRTVNQWLNDVIRGKDVVTVLCENGNKGCVSYNAEMDALASKHNLNYYYFNLDLLDERDRTTLTETYDLPYYKSSGGYVPYTFVMREGKVAYQLKGRNTIEYVQDFFIQYDVIKNNY